MLAKGTNQLLYRSVEYLCPQHDWIILTYGTLSMHNHNQFNNNEKQPSAQSQHFISTITKCHTITGTWTEEGHMAKYH